MILKRILHLLFPPKCVLCRKILQAHQADLCPSCAKNAPVVKDCNLKLSFLAQWTGIWYYKENVRKSLLRYKFGARRSYAGAYGRLLAQKLKTLGWENTDVISWIPISRLRKFRRGYDQAELLARVVAGELGRELVPTLKKIRNVKPQSGIHGLAQRRANILGAYRVIDPAQIAGKRILLMDDILTTGATASECAKTLRNAGAKEVILATVAVANHENPR